MTNASQNRENADRVSDERLQLAIDRLGGLEEIHRSTYAEFFDDTTVLANAASELLALRRPTASEGGEYLPTVIRNVSGDVSELVMRDTPTIYDNHYSLVRTIRDMTTREIIGFAWDGCGDPFPALNQSKGIGE